jgi:hypothetical protein
MVAPPAVGEETMDEGRRAESQSPDDESAYGRGRRERETLASRMPIDPKLRTWLFDMLPGQPLLRLLRNFPDDALDHMHNARREHLLAARSVIDALIADTDRPRQRGPAREIEIE